MLAVCLTPRKPDFKTLVIKPGNIGIDLCNANLGDLPAFRDIDPGAGDDNFQQINTETECPVVPPGSGPPVGAIVGKFL